MVLAIFAPFSQIGAMVLVLSPKRIKLGSCACTHIKALEVGNGSFYPDDAGNLSEMGETGQTGSVIVVAFFALFPHTGAVVLLISQGFRRTKTIIDKQHGQKG